MANSGQVDGGIANGGFRIRVKWSLNSQSVANNSSSVNVKVYLVVSSGYSTQSWMRGSYTVNGVVRNIDRGTQWYYGGENLLAEDNFTIYHNADGTKSFNISATVTSGWSAIGTMPTASDSWSLPTIARASQPSINTYPNNSPDFNIGDTITIHMNRASSSFTHTVKFNYGSTSVTVATGVTNNCTFNTSTVANALYALIPNANVYNGTVSVTTYNGSTNIGTKTCAYKAHVVNANPTFTASYLDSNSTTSAITTDNQVIVRNKSTLTVNFSNAAAQKSATLASASVNILGQTFSTTLSGATATINVGTINTSQNTTANAIVTDSRGNRSTIPLTITVADWQEPTAIITAKRHDNYYSNTDINVDANYSSVNNKNVITIKVRTQKQGESTWSAYQTLQDNVTSVLTLDNEYAWNIQVLLTDSFGGSTTYNAALSRGMPIVFFDRALSSTGFNMFPTYDQAVEIAGRLFVNNEDIVSKFTGIGGAAKAATTNDWNTACGILSGLYMGSNMSNAPAASSNWFFVFHMVHNNLYQRQIAYDFFGINVWTRRMDNGTWGSWVRVDLSSTYSTNEMAVGEWTDGSPVYKKTYTKRTTNASSSASYTLALGIQNLDKIIKVEGTRSLMYYDGEGQPMRTFVGIPHANIDMNNYISFEAHPDNNEIWIDWHLFGSGNNNPLDDTITVYYTKSSS